MTDRFKMFSVCAVLSTLWLTISSWVGWYAVGLGFPDGFQSVGATFDGGVGHLTWPMMGGFEGFDRAWGYHWVGWPMLRSLMGSIIPWSALGDGIALHSMRALLAIGVGGTLLRQLQSTKAAWVGFLTVLLNRGWFCSMAFLYRPENVTALLLWIAALPLIGKREYCSKFINIPSVLSLVLLPSMHPLAWPASILLAVVGSLTIRRSSGTSHWLRRSCLRWWLPLVFGFGFFAAYYMVDPLRMTQLKDTLQTTLLFKSGFEASARRLFLDPKNIFFSFPVLAVLGLALLAFRCGSSFWKEWAWDGLGLSLALVLLSLVYLFAAGHPNTGHAVVMAPFLGYSAGRIFSIDWRSVVVCRFARPALIGQVALCSMPLILTSSSFLFHPPESPRARANAVLARALASTSGRVMIPLSLWEAAGAVSVRDRERIQFVTFPNWVSIERRLAYERNVLGSLVEGDVLIADGTPPELSDPANVLPWPRSATLRGEGDWVKLDAFNAIVNTTISLGSIHRQEMLLGPMTLLRYQEAN
jgi:hypothetical protein